MANRKKSGKQRSLDAYVATTAARQLDTVMDPRLFRALETVLVQSLQSSGNDPQLRDKLNAFSLEVKMQSMARFGFYSADSEVLSALLRRTDPNRKEEPKRAGTADVFEYLSKVLDGDLYSAALTMKSVWDAFGVFLTTASRGFEKGSGVKRSHVMQPLDVMADETWECYKEFFKPWISAASRRHTPRIRSGNVINSELVHRVIVEEQFPATIDQLLGLAPGAALKTLRLELKMLYAGEVVVSAEDTPRVYIAPDPSPAEGIAVAAA